MPRPRTRKFFKAKTYAKAKDIQIFQGQYQGGLRQLPLRAKIYIYLKSTTKGE